MAEKNTKRVYSTDAVIPRNKRREGGAPPVLRPGWHSVTLRLERKGRGGKSVTVIDGLPLMQQQREALLKQVKSMLGTGGTVRDAALEIQVDHRDALMVMLEHMGYRPKRSGG